MGNNLDDFQKERYSRQLNEIDEKKQLQLLKKKVMIVGAGGLGSPLALYLAAGGVGNITIIDHDEVSLSNLNRQIMYNTNDIGKSKSEISKNKLTALNPDVNVISIKDTLTEQNSAEYCKSIDYLVDASDNLKTKFLVNDIGLKLNIPFTIAGVQSMEGQVISVDPHKSACYRCVFGEPKAILDTETLKKNAKREKSNRKKVLGVIGNICGVIGSIEAAEVLKGLIDLGPRLLNSMLMVDLKNMKFMKINVKQNEKCMCAKMI